MIIREKARKKEPSNITYIYMYGCLSSHKLDSYNLYLFKNCTCEHTYVLFY